MTIEACLARLVTQKRITEEQAADARAIHDGILNDDLLRNMDRATAEGYAALKTAEILEATAKEKKLELARRTAVYNANRDRINAHPNGPLAGFMGLYDRDIRNAAGDRLNVSSLETELYRPTIAAKMHEADSAYRSTAAGLRQDTTGIRNMVREMFGVRTGDHVADAAAKGWRDATDWGTEKARSLGKVFDATEDWRLPQYWTSARVNKIGADEFRRTAEQHIASGGLRIFDPETGRIVTGSERAAVLSRAIDNIRKDLGSRTGPSSVFKPEQRVFRFTEGAKGAEAYLSMMDRFGPGQGHYFAMMQSHAQSMARELSMLHVMGPGFRSTGEQLLKDAIEADATRALNPEPKTVWQKMGDTLLRGAGLEGRIAAERLHKYMTGQLSGVESEAMAGVLGGARSFLTSTSMNSAIVTAIPADSVNWAMAANYRGLDSGRLLQFVTDTFLKDNPEKEMIAARLGITAHAASRVALGTKQYADQLVGSGVFQRVADFTLRASGLHAWDTAINRSFTMEFLASIAERGGKTFDELDPHFASFMRDYGFTPEDWSALSRGKTLDIGPAKFLLPESLDSGLQAKLMSAIGDEKIFAYLGGGSNRVRAMATGGAKAGTVGGEFSRSFMLFKSFPVTMVATWGVRAAQDAAGGRVGTAVQLGLFMTMAGAIALQARNVLQGKDPQSMKDGWFWAEAAFQGGAAGFYGDFIKEAFSRSGTSLTEGIIGPLASIPAAAQRLTSGARRVAEEGEHVNFGSALANDISRFTPGLSSMWYARTPFNRFIVDAIRRQIDPDYAQAFARQRERLQKHGQDFFWTPGESAPSRGPDFGALAR